MHPPSQYIATIICWPTYWQVPNVTGCRWVAELADFHFTIKYRSEKDNIDADSLSRMPLDIETRMAKSMKELTSDCIEATVQAIQAQDLTMAWIAMTSEGAELADNYSVDEIRQADRWCQYWTSSTIDVGCPKNPQTLTENFKCTE